MTNSPRVTDTTDPDRARLERVAADPRYRALVRRRGHYAWALTAIMLAIFFGYILLIAFDRALLATPIPGRATTLGIPLGLGVIVAGIGLTALYVRRANRDFDAAVQAIRDAAE